MTFVRPCVNREDVRVANGKKGGKKKVDPVKHERSKKVIKKEEGKKG